MCNLQSDQALRGDIPDGQCIGLLRRQVGRHLIFELRAVRSLGYKARGGPKTFVAIIASRVLLCRPFQAGQPRMHSSRQTSWIVLVPLRATRVVRCEVTRGRNHHHHGINSTLPKQVDPGIRACGWPYLERKGLAVGSNSHLTHDTLPSEGAVVGHARGSASCLLQTQPFLC